MPYRVVVGPSPAALEICRPARSQGLRGQAPARRRRGLDSRHDPRLCRRRAGAGRHVRLDQAAARGDGGGARTCAWWCRRSSAPSISMSRPRPSSASRSAMAPRRRIILGVAEAVVMLIAVMAQAVHGEIRDACAPAAGARPVPATWCAIPRSGMIGFGNIGRAVAQRLAGWECELIATDPYIDPGRGAAARRAAGRSRHAVARRRYRRAAGDADRRDLAHDRRRRNWPR